jgi:hypothetical protein
MLTSPLGEKRTSRKERQKRGGYKSRANAAPAPLSGGKYPKKFNSMGVDGGRRDAVAINNSSAQEQCALLLLLLSCVSVNASERRENWHLHMGRK